MGRTGTFVALAVMVLVGVFGGLASWASSGNATRPVELVYDRIARFLTSNDPMTRCWASAEYAAQFPRYHYVDDDKSRDCYLAPREFKGIYIAEFEGDAFLENVTPSIRYDFSICDAPWLYFDNQTRGMNLISFPNPDYKNQVWELRFIGRRSPEFDFITLPHRYGHLGVSQHAILVDRIIEARLLRTYEGFGDDPDNNFIDQRLPEVSCDNPH